MSSAQHTEILSAERVREELEKILSSATFHGSAVQVKLLRYLVEQSLEGNQESVKEYSIGVDAFGRPESFDPRRDNIVRVQAGRLRSRLARYYESEGLGDPLRIEFPKGSYTATFHADGTTPKNSPVEPDESYRNLPGRDLSGRWKAVAFVVMCLLLTGAGFHYLRTNRRAAGPSISTPSVAVLPFLNRSDDKEGEVFSDGLTDELIDSLGKVPGIHVVARGSAFQFKGKTLDIRKIGPALNVRTVLEGSVRKYGDRLRITAELDDTTTGYRLWSESYDRELQDALAIQRDISQAIVDALGGQLEGKAAPSRESARVNAEAYQNYLKGRYFWNKQTSESTKTAIGYFEQAIAADPTYAGAYAGLAQCYAVMPAFTTTPPREVVPRIRAAATRALQLDSTLVQAHLDLAQASEFEYDWSAAEREFRKGLELNPGDEMAHVWYANYLLRAGRAEEALAENQKALDLDPVSPYLAQSVAGSLYYLRRYDDAIEQYRKALALDPNFGLTHRGLGIVYIRKGMYAQGIAELQMAAKLTEQDATPNGHLGYAYALSGNEAGARELLRELLARSGGEPSVAPAIARIYIGLAQNDQAFQWLQTAANKQAGAVLPIKLDPFFDPLRSDPRFGDLMRLMKLN
jgi:TolB-like protein/Flp pilus assembly protein TadD